MSDYQQKNRDFKPKYKDKKRPQGSASAPRVRAFKTADAIMELGTGEALVSFLDEKGAPSMVERAKILFPLSQIGAVTEGQRGQIMNQSRLYGKYDKIIDRESAFEVLMEEAEAALKAEQEAAEAAAAAEAEEKAAKEQAKSKKAGKSILGGIFGAVVGAAVTSVTSSIGTEVSKKTGYAASDHYGVVAEVNFRK